MKHGNWIPMSKALTLKLPKDREYSEVEAMFSLSVDYDNKTSVSISGYSSLWKWSRKRVSTFLKRNNLEIVKTNKYDRYSGGILIVKEGTGEEQVRDRRGTGVEQVRFINSRHLPAIKSRCGTGEEQVRDRKGSTTNEPNPKPNKKEDIVETKPQPQIPFSQIISFLNEKAKKNYKHTTKATQNKIRARWNEGFRLSDFESVIEKKCDEWLTDEKMVEYLRPETLFGNKFESYLQASLSENTTKKKEWIKHEIPKTTAYSD